MTSLVEDLQRQALDSSVSVATLLRTVKLVAVKLQLGSVQDWVDAELGGYPGDVPNYRVRSGDVRGWNPYRGWLPVQGPDVIMTPLSEKRVGESVSALENMAAASEDTFHIPVPHDLAAKLLKDPVLGTPQVAVFFNQSVFTDILDQVRTRVLDWALELEQAGIMGEGVSFSRAEKERAAEVNISIGTMSGNLMAGDINGPNARANLGSTDKSTNIIGDVFGELKAAIQKAVEEEAERERLISAVDGMAQNKGKPGFIDSYQKFIAAAANHMQLIQPFLPTLTGLISG